MTRAVKSAVAAVAMIGLPALASAQINFQKNGYYVAMGDSVAAGSRVAIVDLYSASLERQGLVTIERRLGLQGPFDFDIHPTNLGHSFIAEEFENAWNNLP